MVKQKQNKNTLGEFLERMYPKHGELQADEDGNLSTTIVDSEMDGITCKFNYDGCVEIDTEGYSYITLDISTLMHLAKLIAKADGIYDKRSEEEWSKTEK